MKYECPSCFLCWEDETKPRELLTYPTCVFCSQSHTQKELLNWQMNQITNLNPNKFPQILSYIYRYFDNKIKEIEEKYEKKKD